MTNAILERLKSYSKPAYGETKLMVDYDLEYKGNHYIVSCSVKGLEIGAPWLNVESVELPKSINENTITIEAMEGYAQDHFDNMR